jgi:tRNA threonylcarbamoyladenosine biosynthesis protein TsaE
VTRAVAGERRAARAIAIASASPEETEAAGARLAGALAEGDVVSVVGALGAGKTRFVRGVLRGLGVAGGGQSPTFVVERVYTGRLVAHHIDLYRLEGEKDLAEVGIPDRFADGGVFLVEWGDRADGLLPERRIDVTIEDLGGTRRRIRVEGPERAAAALGADADA